MANAPAAKKRPYTYHDPGQTQGDRHKGDVRRDLERAGEGIGGEKV